jgi:hypothetical protein
MFDAEEVARIRTAVRRATTEDGRVLASLRDEVRGLVPQVRAIQSRTATSVSLVASDGGNNALRFDPFQVQLVRVVDSYGKQLCLDAVTPWTDTEMLSRNQFEPDGSAKTALGRLMLDLRPAEPPQARLRALSHMIPSAALQREHPERVSSSWVLVYRDLCEWAVLYERIVFTQFATDTLIVRDGLLRSKMFRGELFVEMMNNVATAISRIQREDRRRVMLVGVAKHSKVLAKYDLAISIEQAFPAGNPRYVQIPREIEAKAYVWPEYARDEQTDADGEAPKFVAGTMFFVRFGSRSEDPLWAVDILNGQITQAQEIFGYLLADAINGFPVPFYPRCLQKAHEHAEVVDFDLELLQDEIFGAVRSLVPPTRVIAVEAWRLRGDPAQRRYE